MRNRSSFLFIGIGITFLVAIILFTVFFTRIPPGYMVTGGATPMFDLQTLRNERDKTPEPKALPSEEELLAPFIEPEK